MCSSYIHIILLIGLCLVPSIGFCQSGDDESFFMCTFIYPQGSSVILPQVGDNSIELSRLDEFIRTVLRADSLSNTHIRLTGYCSIEGGYTFNTLLSRNRVRVINDYLQSTYPTFQHYTMDIASVPEDWQGLSDLVREDAEMPDREEVLSILRNGASSDERKVLLNNLNGGRAYTYMEERMFPMLRRVVMEVTRNSTVTATSPSTPLGHLPLAGEEFDAAWNSSPARGRYPKGVKGVMAIKTNVLYLAGLTHSGKHTTVMPNLSIEYFITRSWSVEVGAKYSNWHYDDRKSFQGISGYRLETRYYMLRERHPSHLLSPFIGVYGRFGDFNLREAQNCTGKYNDFGLSGGIYFRLYRRLGLEVGARAGYVRSTPTYYQFHDDHNCYEYETKYNKFRVTDLGASLVFNF